MSMTSKEYEKEMRRILNAYNCDEQVALDSEQSRECLATCIDEKYIIGTVYQRNANGDPLFDRTSPRVTDKGLQFLERRKYKRWLWTEIRLWIVLISSVIGAIYAIMSMLRECL